MSLIGIHISDFSDINKSINSDITLFQSQVSATKEYINNKKYKKTFKTVVKRNIKLVVHASYSINLSRNWKITDWWIQQLITEINIAEEIGAFAVVIHTGKQLKLSENVSINNMYTSFLHIHKLTNNNIKILIETPSGQGTETLIELKSLCRFMNKFYNHPNKEVNVRFGLCIDTCHIYASGIDITKKTILKNYFNTINKCIGIDKIKLCHINDSKGILGSKLDRHNNIGDGKIGHKPLIDVVKFMNRLKIPIILETPYNKIHNDYKYLIKHIN
jgi:deoxyribonuclease-4